MPGIQLCTTWKCGCWIGNLLDRQPAPLGLKLLARTLSQGVQGFKEWPTLWLNDVTSYKICMHYNWTANRIQQKFTNKAAFKDSHLRHEMYWTIQCYEGISWMIATGFWISITETLCLTLATTLCRSEENIPMKKIDTRKQLTGCYCSKLLLLQ